jgi:hypothetical protein
VTDRATGATVPIRGFALPIAADHEFPLEFRVAALEDTISSSRSRLQGG